MAFAQRKQPATTMTPPVQPRAAVHISTQAHRRPPAHRSVSLLHSPRARPQQPQKHRRESSSGSDGQVATHPAGQPRSKQNSPSSLQALGGRDSSGESSNAEKWFEKSNNEPRDNSDALMDNDPPFFMRNSSSSETPPDQQQRRVRQYLDVAQGPSSLPYRTGLLHLGTDGSSTEEFRSVIDDLTVENKKLKRRLKKYEKLHDSHLKDEKLFELRIHGLSPEKKHELEQTLRKFAASLNTRTAAEFPVNGYDGLLPTQNTRKTTSSQTSLQHADSAYASMSASGQGSSAPSGADGKPAASAPFRQSTQSRHQNIHSFLHHIPEGLLPQQHPATMSERAKKKLVVRRLEQIFAGKGAVGAHQHPLQQQEVSQIAARADRSAPGNDGQSARLEGHREAHIMMHETEDPLDPSTMKQMVPASQAVNGHQPHPDVDQQDFAASEKHPSPDQRPTRPLDLDPHRAQVPAENINYIRHLGFSPPDSELEKSPMEGHGWIYLNLLVNMAQLHTLNVTAEFVRKAINEYSEKFELSRDCRKVRWTGDRSVTRTSSNEGGSSNDLHREANTPDGQSPRKRPRLSRKQGSQSELRPNMGGRTNSSQRPAHESNKYVYTPLFFHKDNTESDDSSSDMEDDMSSVFPAPIGGDSSGMTSSNILTTSAKPKKRDDGPIIFYNNARFCTDLSGNRKPLSNQAAPLYRSYTVAPIGKPASHNTAEDGFVETRGPLEDASVLPEPMDLDDNPIPESMELNFPQTSPMRDQSGNDVKPFPLDVSGIGGVYPADNFAIAVESRQARTGEAVVFDVARPLGSKAVLPPKFAALFDEAQNSRKTVPVVQKKMVDARVRQLPPSSLPPALCYMPSSSSHEDDDDSDAGDDEMSIAPDSPGNFPPSAAPQILELPYATSSDEEDDDDSDDESDGSLDLLAAARQVDPDAIRAQEREYDANMAERLAEEIPAGSSAATAGGGSGFASPANGVDKREYRAAKRDAQASQAAQLQQQQRRPASLKRARTSADSMAVHGRAGADDGDSDDGSDEGSVSS